MAPISAIDGDFGSIDWGNLEGTHSYKREWKRIVDGDEQAWLHFPPLIVPGDIIDHVVVVMLAQRRGNNLQFWGAFHRNIDKSVKECNVSVTVELTFHHKNGKIEQRKINQSITFKHSDVDGGFWPIFSMSPLTWADLSSALAPRATRLVFKSATHS